MARPNLPICLWKTSTAGSYDAEVDCKWGSRLRIMHEISGSPATGGFVKAVHRNVAWLPPDATNPVLLNITPVVVAASPGGVVRSSGIVTVTTSTAHGLVANDTVAMRDVYSVALGLGSEKMAYPTNLFNVNGWTVSTVPTTTTFTLGQAGDDDTGGGGYVYSQWEAADHGAGYNEQSSAQTTSYISVYDYVGPYMRLKFSLTDGVHRVWVELLAD